MYPSFGLVGPELGGWDTPFSLGDLFLHNLPYTTSNVVRLTPHTAVNIIGMKLWHYPYHDRSGEGVSDGREP